DVVDLSNLQRQVVHTSDRVGERKVESARLTINALNPDVTVVAHEEMLVAGNVERIIAGYDVILDGTDTFETRYILNDAAVAAGIPVIHASVFRFEGQLTVFKPYEGPCYRCLYPTPPPPELAPGCSVAGVLGVVPGIMGLLQANEVLKLLLGIGDTLAGRLLLFDALDASFTELRLRRDPNCPACSDAAVEARRSGRPLDVATVGADAPFLLGSFGTVGNPSPEARA
ncbi:MAG TPA: ThiF family adenylyltransferase, partial [Candidatus Limnocylindrales bacterium]|nr:ThiF family adenylyltransferase [Candidatus Limnocylindrales bacterium]